MAARDGAVAQASNRESARARALKHFKKRHFTKAVFRIYSIDIYKILNLRANCSLDDDLKLRANCSPGTKPFPLKTSGATVVPLSWNTDGRAMTAKSCWRLSTTPQDIKIGVIVES